MQPSVQDEDVAQFLVSTFKVRETLFGIDTMRVMEVVLVGAITTVHHAPDYIRGIINLRGRIVTVIDLARKLGVTASEVTPESRIVIVEWKGEHVGLIVDSVSEIVPVERDHTVPPPANLRSVKAEYLSGVYRCDLGLVTILDIDKTLEQTDA